VIPFISEEPHADSPTAQGMQRRRPRLPARSSLRSPSREPPAALRQRRAARRNEPTEQPRSFGWLSPSPQLTATAGSLHHPAVIRKRGISQVQPSRASLRLDSLRVRCPSRQERAQGPVWRRDFRAALTSLRDHPG